ncbi:MAG: hypothetical protein WD696_04920 [Bryobacteraceae bacterium]
MPFAEVSWERRGFGRTARSDTWWLSPLLVFLGLGTFVVYTTWAALQGEHYYWGPYLSPFYSPELFGDSPHSWLGLKPGWWPGFVLWSPAILVLWAPGLFRLTCYYYRGAYYKSFWADPPACAVGEPRKSYWGENSLPLILHNIHRYFLYLAIGFLFVLSYDVWKAMWFTDAATGSVSFGVGFGTVLLAANVVCLGGYALGCHSLRHLIGGRFDLLSPVRLKTYDCVSCLNRRHKVWAWTSLCSVGLSDLYVRLLSMGVIRTDWRLL